MDYARSTVGPLVLCTLLVVLALPGCALELDYGPPTDASGDAFVDTGGGTLDVGPPDDTGLDAGPTDTGVDADAFVPTDIGPVECVSDGDCLAAFGDPPCGAWQCAANTCGVVCPNCDDTDLDGYGQGTGCAGADCDDTDPNVQDTSSRACAPSSGTVGVGVCREGTEACTAGSWGACIGAQGATPESCNGVDDDCDGVVDDGFGMVSCGIGACTTTVPVCSASGALSVCTPPTVMTSTDGCGGGDEDCDGRIDENCTNCVWVATGGSDASPDPRVVTTPFATVQHAIDFAAADPVNPLRVCLLSNGCSATTAVFNGPVTMASGVHVQGNYAPGGATLCGSAMRTQIQTGDATGVLFDDSVVRHTELSDVMIVPSSAATAAGVTVDGAHSAVLSNVWIIPQSAFVTNGYGVDVKNDGDAVIQRSVIYGGHASGESIGIRVVGARATIQNNCPGNLDAAGRCTMGCVNSGSSGVRGRADTTPSRSTTSYAILLRDASGSIVESTATCGQPSLDGAGIRIDGPATGVVVRGDFIPGWGPQNASYGIDVGGCGGASPLITDNAEINAEAPMSAPAVAIRSMGDCHPIIENNLRIVSGLEGSMTSVAILCGADGSGVSSRCVIEGNPVVHASVAGFPVTATGVRCEADACARIVQNEISGTQGATLVGLQLGTSMALVARNRISGGCASVSATGILAANSRARIENNVVLAGLPCGAGALPGASRYVALAASATDATYAVDVHGNDFDPIATLLPGVTCESRGVQLTGHPGVDVGVLRGNVILAGTCLASYPLFEVDADSDPISLEHNDLVPAVGRPVYRDEGATDVLTAVLVDALGDTVLGGNLDAPAGFASYPADLHLAAGSMCIDADFSPGAPIVDFDGRARDAMPDIGAYEH